MKYKDAPLWCRWFQSRKCWQNRKRVLKSECTPCLLAQLLNIKDRKWYKEKKPIINAD